MILKYVNGSWQLCPYLIKYSQHGEKNQSYDINLQWWEDFTALWDHTVIDEVIDVTYTAEQKERFNQIRHLSEDFGNLYSEYVETGTVTDLSQLPSSHPLNLIVLNNKITTVKEGTMVESGHNSNGDYMKFANGVLICQSEISSDNIITAYPHEFIKNPTVSFDNSGVDSIKYNSDKTVIALLTTENNGPLKYMAIGKWK